MIRGAYPALDRLMPGDFYAAYQLDEAEIVATVPKPPRVVRRDLVDGGPYERTSLLSAAKYHPREGDRVDVASLRRVDPDDARRQFHVHLFDEGAGETLICSHLEYRPDLRPVGGERLPEAVDRLREHYKPSWGSRWGDGVTYVQGRHCRQVHRLVRALDS